jgi:Icc-related predicted phosphoesterase
LIRRISLSLPAESLQAEGDVRPIRLLAVSDEQEKAFDFEVNRTAIEPIDAVIGAGDLEPDYLDFLANAFRAPLLYVRGNHDRGSNWTALGERLPHPLDERPEVVSGITLAGLSWPGEIAERALHDDRAAWRQAISFFVKRRVKRPLVMVSHVPPLGLGDTPEDLYHRGFAAYHWLCRRVQPVLWLHGHTSMAAATDWRTSWGGTTLINVTGAVLVEIGRSDAESEK